ncbi:MAG: AAA family ATPase, partial [Ignavibacterium sp.]|nr:AAA family ATPase [Ignavibacterium sp.]
MRIKKIDIKSFRGIPKSLSINFPFKNNKPASLVILGDNGVGKSSIVDA